MQKLIYGKDETQRVVCVEPTADSCVLFIEDENGITTKTVPNSRYILYSQRHSDKMQPLEGELHYDHLIEYTDEEKFRETISMSRAKRYDFWTPWNAKEAFLLRSGVTYFKGMKPQDVSILSFDIETTGVTHDANSQVLLISNYYRKGDTVVSKLFSLEDYEHATGLFLAWVGWVREMNPSILTGHNILGFDLPYLTYCADRAGVALNIGRDRSPLTFEDRTSEFRKDGSQSYTYRDAHVYGREIVDTFFLAMAYDATEKKYESYGLKSIVKAEGLEKEGRAFVDASKIKVAYAHRNTEPEAWADWELAKQYAIDDAEDVPKLFDKMIPAYFYLTQSVPRSFQRMINGANNTGGQVNAIMLRAYLQDGHSIPKADQAHDYEGATSFGNPGIYKHVVKWDVTSMYPSIIMLERIWNKDKDPEGYFLQLVETFYNERVANKRKAAETKDPYFKGLSDAQKIFINSAYGFLATNGLNFNSPGDADRVTAKGREVLDIGIKWAEAKGYRIVNADTDSFSYSLTKKPTKKFLEAELTELNSLYPDRIRWEADGTFKTVVVVAAKNYVLQDYKGDYKMKGNSLKATMKEPALKRFLKDVVEHLLADEKERILFTYMRYANEIANLTDITDWAYKKTVTKSVLNPQRTQEEKIKDALKGKDVSEGDKVYLFNLSVEELCLAERFDGTYYAPAYFNKLYNTLAIFDALIPMDLVPNFEKPTFIDLLQVA